MPHDQTFHDDGIPPCNYHKSPVDCLSVGLAYVYTLMGVRHSLDEMVRILLDHCGVTNHSLWTLLYGDVEMRRQVHMSFDALLYSISINS